ncbi:MAG: ABC transporter permease subunit [Actinomycetota bacterium]|nr:ABC transporter permease subunit [Actinomycetota bacterium]
MRVVALAAGGPDWTFLKDNANTIVGWFAWHVWLSVIPVVIGLVIALPIGWVMNRYRWAYPPLVSIAGILYTIPSIALFVVLPGLLHTKVLSPVNVVVALTIYTVALMVRVVADGLASVPGDVAQAATAMGYRGLQRLVKVELPIAVPVIAAGLRVATVANVSLVAVAALVGVPQLGQLFTNGFQVASYTQIGAGIVLCVLLALVLDTAVLVGTRLLTPWRKAVRPS